jgi:hypothetical protein
VTTSYPDSSAVSAGTMTAAAAVLDPQPLTAAYDAACFIVNLWRDFPSRRVHAKNKTLAERYGCSEATITRRAQAAEKAGYARVEHFPGRGRIIHLLVRPFTRKKGAPAPDLPPEVPSPSPRPCGGSAEALRRVCGPSSYKTTEPSVQKPSAKEQQHTGGATSAAMPPSVPTAIVVSLVEKGMDEAVARSVVQAHGEERAKAALAAFAQAGRAKVRNAGAWLCAAIVRGIRPNLEPASASPYASDRGERPQRIVRAPTVPTLATGGGGQRQPPRGHERGPGSSGDPLAGLTPRERLAALMATSTHRPTDRRQGTATEEKT